MKPSDLNPKPAPQREEALFQAVAQLTGAERAAFLNGACHGDPALRQRMEALLAAHDAEDSLLAEPPDVKGRAATIKLDLADDPADAAVGLMIGRYKVLEKIGEGGCGVVYVAEQTEPVRRRVALKVIKLGMDTKQVVARFEAERQALAMMDHPNIAKVLDAGTIGAPDSQLSTPNSQLPQGRPYFVMELVRGIRITEYCDQNQLTTKERLDLFIKVCQAIQHAHQKGIIHRDIKPSNILVTLHDGVPVPKVIDFGIAKATEGRLTDATVYTQLHQFIGTPAYMSPEQAEMSGLDIDTRSDIYALGVLLYELLTGKTPFDAKELMASGIDEMRRTIREKEPLRPSTRLTQELAASGEMRLSSKSAIRNPQSEIDGASSRRLLQIKELVPLLRGDLDWIVMKCLEKDRARRYDTANGLTADLKRHLNNEPVVARPPSAGYKLQKAFRRNKVVFASSAAVALALIVGLGISVWQAAVATRARKVAETARVSETEQRVAAQAAQKEAEAERARAAAREKSEQTLRYIAGMNLAQQAWEANDVGRLRQLLEETAGYPDHGFEWFYWQKQTHLEIRTFHGHTEPIWSAAFFPDGQRVVTGSGRVGGFYKYTGVPDKTARIWDAVNGRVLVTLRGHSGEILSVAVSPDGQRVLTGSTDATAKLWDAATGNELRTFHGHQAGIICGAFSPNGRRILTGGFDATAKVWDAATGQELLTFTGHGHTILVGEFSPDGQRILTAAFDRIARIWDPVSGQEILTLMHGSTPWAAAFSPDGNRIVTGGVGGTAKVWDSRSGEPLLTLRGHTGDINKSGAQFSPNGRRIVTSGVDRTARVWDAENGAELLVLKGHTEAVLSAAFSPDGRRILTASWDRTAKIWDSMTAEERLPTPPQRVEAQCVTFSSDGRRMIAGAPEHTALIFDVATGTKLLALVGHEGPVKAVAFSPDGDAIVTGSEDQTAKLWTATGAERISLRGHSGWVRAVAFSTDGQRVATGSVDQTAKVWDVVSGRELVRLEGHKGPILSVAFSPDGRQLLTGSGDHRAKLWDTTSGQEQLTLRGHSRPIQAVAFSPDGQQVATVSLDRTARIWQTATGEERVTMYGQVGDLLSVTFSPDGRRVITGSADHTVKVWEATTGKELLSLDGQKAAILSVVVLPDGNTILTGARDSTAKLWQAASTQQAAEWRQIEADQAERLVVQQREAATNSERERALRAGDPGAIRQWLVLAPVPVQAAQDGSLREPVRAERPYEEVNADQLTDWVRSSLDSEQIQGEANLRPRASQRVRVGPIEGRWSVVEQDDYGLDFNRVLGEFIEYAVAYAVCYIKSEADQGGLALKIGSDDSAKVYLNGRLVYRHPHGGMFRRDRHTVTGIELKAGLNVLVFKVVNGFGDWEGSIRLTDAEGQPVKGIQITLDPGNEIQR